MKKNAKKMIAPFVIILLVSLYLSFYAVVILVADDVSLPFKILGAAIPAAFIGVGIFVLIERIKEIRSGEEDDLSKY